MKVVELKIDVLKEYENNPRHNEAAVDKVAESIKQFGFKVPIIIDQNNVIVTGHTRIKAARKLGIKKVPCIVADDLSPEQIKAFRLADNKVSEFATWDEDKLYSELMELKVVDFDIKTFGFDTHEIDTSNADIDSIVEKFENERPTEIHEDEFDVDEAFDDITTPTVKHGDVWQLGRHRLMCGDSTKEEDINRLMDDADVDLIFTDPPYGMSAVSKSGVLSKTYKTDIMNDDTNEVAMKSFALCQQMFHGKSQVWWGANYYTECLPSSECWIVWDKNNGASDQTDRELAWSNFRSVVRQFTLASEKTNRVHPTQKPIRLIEQILNKFDKENRFNNVLDIFGGSGSTMIACEQTNRNCYTMELDPKFCDVIIQRWETFTGEKAVLIHD